MQKVSLFTMGKPLVLLLSIFPVLIIADTAQQHHGHNLHRQGVAPLEIHGDDRQQITATLKTAFDRPDSPLTVFPVVIEGRHAVAGWSQDGRGGRAFLEKTATGWLVRMCSGQSLTRPDTLTGLGISPFAAQKLTHQLQQKEAAMTPDKAALLSSFKGTVFIDSKRDRH